MRTEQKAPRWVRSQAQGGPAWRDTDGLSSGLGTAMWTLGQDSQTSADKFISMFLSIFFQSAILGTEKLKMEKKIFSRARYGGAHL